MNGIAIHGGGGEGRLVTRGDDGGGEHASRRFAERHILCGQRRNKREHLRQSLFDGDQEAW